MAHHKRRHRRHAGIKGCCGMCMLRSTDGRRNGRLITKQEMNCLLTLREESEEYDVICESHFGMEKME